MRAMESVFHLKACDFLEQLKTAAATFLTFGTAMTAGQVIFRERFHINFYFTFR